MKTPALKSLITVALLLGGAASWSAHAADQDVFDQRNNDELKKQTDILKSNTDKLDRNSNALIGKRGMGDLYNDGSSQSQRKTVLPDNFRDQFQAMRVNGMSSASSRATDIYKQASAYDCTAQIVAGPKDADPDLLAKRRKACEAITMAAPTAQALLENGIARAQARIGTIQSLLNQIDALDGDSNDAKRAVDLANRIQSEMAMMQNEKMIMDMAMQSHAQQLAISQQLFQELQAKDMAQRMSTSGK